MKCYEKDCEITDLEQPLYRNSPKSVIPAKWSCIVHVDKKFKPSRATREISEFISGSLGGME